MCDKSSFVTRVIARVNALRARDWFGNAGEIFRRTTEDVSAFSQKNVRIAERLSEAPDVVANTLKLKANDALLKAAEEEGKQIQNELARRTIEDKTRQEKATADRMESEAHLTKLKVMDAQIELFKKLKDLGITHVADANGNLTVLKAPLGFDWDGLERTIVKTPGVALPSDPTAAAVSTEKTTVSGSTGLPSEEQFRRVEKVHDGMPRSISALPVMMKGPDDFYRASASAGAFDPGSFSDAFHVGHDDPERVDS